MLHANSEFGFVDFTAVQMPPVHCGEAPHGAPSASVPWIGHASEPSQESEFTWLAHCSTCPEKLFAPGALESAPQMASKLLFVASSTVAVLLPHFCSYETRAFR